MSTLFVVGLGPGGAAYRTPQASAALEAADVICGYTAYVKQIAAEFPEKETYTTPMRGEMDRCQWAVNQARSGRTVAMVCSGDSGVYGMASPLLQLAGETDSGGGQTGEAGTVHIEIVPGVTAALSGAAVLGAPLANDFCVISLSDLLTPWEQIERRLRAAAAGDFTICIYNPSSHRRKDSLRRACGILLAAGKAPGTVCGLVRSIGRPGTSSRVLTLEALAETETDMLTTVFIGSSATVKTGGRMVTPRGYPIR